MKKNIPLIIGISLPFVIIFLVFASIGLSKALANPDYDFIYSDTNQRGYYNYGAYYEVENGKIVRKENTPPERRTVDGDIIVEKIPARPEPKLFIYDAETDTSRQISFEEAVQYSVDPSVKSPDGYVIEFSYGHNGIFELFGSRDERNSALLKKGFASKKVYLTTSSNYYYEPGFFLGWVIE